MRKISKQEEPNNLFVAQIKPIFLEIEQKRLIRFQFLQLVDVTVVSVII